MKDHLWNEDGTPKRPDPAEYGNPEKYAQAPFADLAIDEDEVRQAQLKEHYISYVRTQAEFRKRATPDIGDTVHYMHVQEDGEHVCQAAIVSNVHPFQAHVVVLFVLPPNAITMPITLEGVDHDEEREHGSWHWPESQ